MATQRNPFLFMYPREVGRLFWRGYVCAPDGNQWNIVFTPGIVRSFFGFKSAWQTARRVVTWGWNLGEHRDIVKDSWRSAMKIKDVSVDLIEDIPTGISDGKEHIVELWDNAPFGWIPRVIKNIIWNCAVVPCAKLIVGAVGIVIASPLFFLLSSVIQCVGKFALGNIAAVLMGIVSFVPLVVGSVISGLVAAGSSLSRFPKVSDNGRYGIYLLPKRE